jgi:RNA polymerase sigma factor (sigma-70 family)
VEASALPASVGVARARLGLGAPLLRLRSDEQLISLFRAGNEDAFRVIHDRYRGRMLAYARQMLAATAADPEDAVQEVFVRAYAGLRANRRDLALRAWLYRIAHNRCVDELRRPHPPTVEAGEELGEIGGADPHVRAEQREALRRLIADVQRLPEQQRSALLMRELAGMPYAELSGALGVSVPAVKSLLVRARVGLVEASEARDTACASIRQDLIVAHDRGVRASGRARRHLRDCSHCASFRTEVQGVSRGLGLLLPALGPLGAAAKLVGLHGLGLGLGGGGGAAAGSGTGAAAAGTTAAASATATAGTTVAATATTTAAVAGTGTVAVTGTGALAAAGAGHVVTIIAATALAAGGAIGIQHEVAAGSPHGSHHHPTAVAAAAPSAHHSAAAPTPAAVAAAPAPDAASRPGARDTGVAPAGDRTAVPTRAPAIVPSHTVRVPTRRVGGLHAPHDGFPSAGPTTTLPVTTTTPAAPTEPTTTVTTTTPTVTTTTPTTGPVTTTTPTLPVTTTPITPTDPTSTVPVTTTPISGSGPASPVTSGSGNPGTATGIVPVVAPASTYGRAGSGRHRPTRWRVGQGAGESGTVVGWTSHGR